MRKSKITFLLLLLLALPAVNAQQVPTTLDDYDFILINSNDWKDIYQGLLYAKLTGVQGDFIATADLYLDVVGSIPSGDNVLLLERSGKEQVKGLGAILASKGLTFTTEAGSDEIGVRLAKEIEPKGYIITDERYPYNAISVAPYALLKGYYVIFASQENDDDIKDLLGSSEVLITYGIIDSGLQSTLSVYEPIIIDKGGKFDNNIHMVKEFLKEKPGKQVIVTNGEFLELGLIDDFNPILFIGSSNAPDTVVHYLEQSQVGYLVVVGNYLTDLAKGIKQKVLSSTGKDLFVVVRFAKTPRVVTDQFSEPYALEYYPLPLLEPKLSVTSIAYNRLSKNLEVTYTNPSQIPVFFSSTFTITNAGGVYTLGDEDAQTIVAGQEKTILYGLDLAPSDLAGKVFTIFGDYPVSMEYLLEQDFSQIDTIELLDNSALEITGILYDKTNRAFFITVKNPARVSVYADLELIDVIIDGVATTIGTKEVFGLEPDEEREVFIRARLSELDLVENENVLVRGVYGQREKVRYKTVERTLPLTIRLIKPLYLVLGTVALAVLLLLVLVVFGRKKEYECQSCGHRTKGRGLRRHACGGKYQRR